jgi:hypothetical protein
MLLSEIASYLEASGVGTRAEDLFAGEIPIDAPAFAIGLLETGGGPPRFVHERNDRRVESPGLQVRVRGPDYEPAREKIEAIVQALTFRHRVLSGVRYLSLVPTQSPFNLGRDGNERHVLVCNFEVSKEPS